MVTPLGKLVAGVVMVTGLGLFALPIGIIANGFVNGLSRRRFAITWTMLRELPLFAGLEMTVLDDVLEAATSIIVREHGQLTFGGAEARMFYLIVGGSALADDGETLREIGPGTMIGAEAMDHAGLYRDTVLARTDLRAIAISAEELRWLARKYPLVNERLAPLRTSGTARTGDGIDALKAENTRLRGVIADLMLEREERKKSEPVS